MSNARIMEYVGEDFLSHPVYKCLETGVLYKDITLGSDNPQLYSCGNDFDGDPDTPIKSDLEIQLVGRESEPNQFDYMMLSRLQSDCDYYLGYGNRFAWALIPQGRERAYFSNEEALEQITEWEKARMAHL